MSTTIQLTELEKLTGKKTNELLQLKTLDLHYRQLKSIPSEIGYLSNLENLVLYANQLTTLPSEIGQLTNLRELSVNKNQLTELPKELAKLSKLTLLDASSNNLSTVRSEIGHLSHLQSLNLSANKLDNLPVELCNLEKTMTYFEENPLRSFRREIVRQGAKAIMTYLEEAKNGTKSSFVKPKQSKIPSGFSLKIPKEF